MKCLKPSVCFTLTAHLGSDWPHFQMQRSHTWPVATVLGGTDLNHNLFRCAPADGNRDCLQFLLL